jgi:isopenicillin N synthase-like dioxygenase
MDLPILNIGALVSGSEERRTLAAALHEACRKFGFFYIIGHGIDEKLQQRLEQVSREFFTQPLDQKLAIRMSRGGRAWRGYFPVGGELTSGRPDLKEGIYFGAELDQHHPEVQAGTPLHGPNLFPASIPGFRSAVLEYMEAMTQLGHILMAGISLSLGFDESYLAHTYTSAPLTLFRIFNYPVLAQYSAAEYAYGVGEHTDYGFLTILKQDMSGGLQVKAQSQWIDVTPVPNSFVCNIGDMLDRLSGGLYLSAPHRVQHRPKHDRLSFAFFFDPNFHAEVKLLPVGAQVRDNKTERWDRVSVHEFRGTYGDYLLSKVSKVFPELGRKVL